MNEICMKLNETIEEMHAEARKVLSFWEGEAAVSFMAQLKEAESLKEPYMKENQDIIL